jgi:hypothetical protein
VFFHKLLVFVPLFEVVSFWAVIMINASVASTSNQISASRRTSIPSDWQS